MTNTGKSGIRPDWAPSEAEIPADTRVESAEVFYRTGDIRTVTTADIVFLKEVAGKNPRKRSRLCLHGSVADSVHEMVILHNRDAYVRPHAHKSKEESLLVLEGRATAIFFDQEGTIMRQIPLAAARDGDASRSCFYRLRPGQYHSLLIESEWLVFHEVTTGPFSVGDTLFPSWAPDGSNEARGVAWLIERTGK